MAAPEGSVTVPLMPPSVCEGDTGARRTAEKIKTKIAREKHRLLVMRSHSPVSEKDRDAKAFLKHRGRDRSKRKT
jgi:hypothetical protein